MPRTAQAYIVRDGFAVAGKDGVPEIFCQGDVIPGDHKIVKTHKHLLRPVMDMVERATAAPGEHRPIAIPQGDDE